jgi:hypothetical protein
LRPSTAAFRPQAKSPRTIAAARHDVRAGRAAAAVGPGIVALGQREAVAGIGVGRDVKPEVSRGDLRDDGGELIAGFIGRHASGGTDHE